MPEFFSKRHEYIALINQLRGTEPLQLMVKFLQLLIDETRAENDYVAKESVMHNQGKIHAYKDILEAIENGIQRKK
jgi:hypothetical protein